MLNPIEFLNCIVGSTVTVITPDWANRLYRQDMNLRLSKPSTTVHRAKIIFGGKLRNPNFCHIFGMERLFFLFKKGMCWPGLVF